MLGYELEECFPDVSFHITAERRIIPNYVSLAVTSGSGCLYVLVEAKVCCVSSGPLDFRASANVVLALLKSSLQEMSDILR